MIAPRRRAGGQSSVEAGEPVYRLDLMTQDDVPAVSRVERRCFPNPWPASAYRRELQNPVQNHYVVLREIPVSENLTPNGAQHAPENGANVHASSRGLPRRSLLPIGLGRRHGENGAGQPPIIGFAGMWLAFDEAHVTTIGVDPDYRGHGLGELLLLCMVDEAIARGAGWLTLEVRVSNEAAQALYRKYGFTAQGTRKRYYSDNHEDAIIMWSRALSDPEYRGVIESRRRALARRLEANLAAGPVSPFRHRPIRTAAR
jgi:ribosomal-protein-alanine N-acetyltransferase